MRLEKVDLNLFKAFDTIYAERSLTRAAEVLHVTQPAMSNTLRRLRETFNDPLFVRSREGMLPTPVADNVVNPVRQALKLFRSSLSEYDRFEPATSDRTFRIAMSDMAEALYLPRLLQQLEKPAPHISLRTSVIPRQELVMELANNNVDLAVDSPLLSGPQLMSAPLLNDEYICVLRKGHPLESKTLTLTRYMGLSHLHLSSRRRGIGQVDLALKGMGKRRHITMRAQHYLVSPLIIASTDLALSIPSSLATCLGLSGRPLPFEVQPLLLNLFWHTSVEKDPGNRWLRDQFINLVQ